LNKSKTAVNDAAMTALSTKMAVCQYPTVFVRVSRVRGKVSVRVGF